MFRRRRALWPALAGVFVILCAGALTLRALYVSNATYTITYKVTGTGARAEARFFPGAGLIAADSRASRLEEQIIPLPWEQTYISDSLLNRRWARIQLRGAPGDVLTCEVWIDGKLAETRSDVATAECGYDQERNPVP